jgi:hypothetical protein
MNWSGMKCHKEMLTQYNVRRDLIKLLHITIREPKIVLKIRQLIYRDNTWKDILIPVNTAS